MFVESAANTIYNGLLKKHKKRRGIAQMLNRQTYVRDINDATTVPQWLALIEKPLLTFEQCRLLRNQGKTLGLEDESAEHHEAYQIFSDMIDDIYQDKGRQIQDEQNTIKLTTDNPFKFNMLPDLFVQLLRNVPSTYDRVPMREVSKLFKQIIDNTPPTEPFLLFKQFQFLIKTLPEIPLKHQLSDASLVHEDLKWLITNSSKEGVYTNVFLWIGIVIALLALIPLDMAIANHNNNTSHLTFPTCPPIPPRREHGIPFRRSFFTPECGNADRYNSLNIFVFGAIPNLALMIVFAVLGERLDKILFSYREKRKVENQARGFLGLFSQPKELQRVSHAESTTSTDNELKELPQEAELQQVIVSTESDASSENSESEENSGERLLQIRHPRR
jgi:hypothetical protein